MAGPLSPLTPVRPEQEQPPRKQPVSARASLRRLLIPMTVATAIAFYLGSTPAILVGAIVWLFWVMRYVLLTQVLDPSGDSTPSVNQHSNIGAMVARGDYAKAAEAYRAAIAADPEDIVACEHLALLALREMKDYDLALFAYREAERRATEPRRQLGYAMQIAGIYRDCIKDSGRAIVELRRILARYPDAPNASSLRAELGELKAHHFETP